VRIRSGSRDRSRLYQQLLCVAEQAAFIHQHSLLLVQRLLRCLQSVLQR
jgi:hypothetical protein